MLRINRLRGIIRTDNGDYCFDKKLNDGLNFIASLDNTSGKSSVLDIIYYCLGFEQIIGGTGEHVLTSVYKTTLDDAGNQWNVLESDCYLEISNGEDVITILRAAKSVNRNTHLITVFYADIDSISDPSTISDDMYVNMRDAATNDKGFHTFLEKFLHLELPTVPAVDGAERKLYLPLIFSSMFIEQKRGWAGIFAGIPYFGINESKKRIVEFVIGLDTLSNERKKSQINIKKSQIENDWETTTVEFSNMVNREACKIMNLPSRPKLLDQELMDRIHLFKMGFDTVPIANYINDLNEKYQSLAVKTPRVIDNFDELQNELSETENSITSLEDSYRTLLNKIAVEKKTINSLRDDLEVVNFDLRNNKDVAKLKRLGSDVEASLVDDLCPLCNQKIQDSLLLAQNEVQVMSVDENIRHLDAQKKMLEYALQAHKQNKEDLSASMTDVENKLFTLRRLAKSLRSDLYSIDDDLSESIVYKKIQIENEVEKLTALENELGNVKGKLVLLSERWKSYLEEQASLPKKYYTDDDEQKIAYFQRKFRENLKRYGYKSIANIDKIEISKETYLPTIEGFDMKFDSSASDNIRSIWAFTMALLQTSIYFRGNHPGVVIFDEPDQHSIIINDLKEFIASVEETKDYSQVVFGITLKDTETKEVIEKTESKTLVLLEGKAYQQSSASDSSNKE